MAETPVVIPLARQECLDRLSTAPVGRVVINVGALPAIRTVRFALSPGYVVFRVAPRSALSRAAAGILAFGADHFDPDAGEGWCVQVVGRSEEVTEPAILGELGRLPLGAWTPPGAADHVFRLAMDSVSGQWVSWAAPESGGATNR